MTEHTATASDEAPLLSVRDLVVQFKTEDGWMTAVDGLSYDLKRGETLGIVGESGSGKSVTNLAVMGLLPMPPARVPQGKVLLNGEDLLGFDAKRMRKIRGNKVSMIFQDPMTSLNPFLRVSTQLAEMLEIHKGLRGKEATDQVVAMLERVGIPDARARATQYPHQFSGGMRQRVMIAMMLLNQPQLLIADEPTTALDVTIQAQILDLLRDLQRDHGTAITLITHDLGVVAGMADHVVVMNRSKVVETGDVDTIFHDPKEPYTQGLLSAVPQLGSMAGKSEPEPFHLAGSLE
ncbi:MAG: ABC transporter ATP-binding protein [Myxococcota bacterium]|nr:ABC transporter ATP-binding protein [Myxococcota bacterium]